VAHGSAVGRELTEFLVAEGIAVADAGDFVAELLRDYPLVRRAGVPEIAVRLGDLGVSPPVRAREVTLALLAFEWRGRLSYEQTLDLLGREFAASDALAAALCASGLRRRLESVPAPSEREGARGRLARLALAWLAGR